MARTGRNGTWETSERTEPPTPAGRWVTAGEVGLPVAAVGIALAVLGVGAGLALHAGGVFGTPIPTVDAAAADSYVLWRQAILATVPGWLEPLKFVAVATALSGIALTLNRVLAALEARADTNVETLPQLIGTSRQGA